VSTRATTRVRATLAAVAASAAGPASAHEKWFHPTESLPLRWDLFFRPLPLAFAAAVLLATAVAALWWRARGRRGFVPGPEFFGATPDTRSALYSFLPLMIGIHVAVPLLVNGVQGNLFSPDNHLPGAWRYFVGLAQTGVALALFYGGLARLAGVLLGLLWLLGVVLLGPEPMLDNALYLGVAAFFYLAGRGPISADRLLFPRFEPSAALMRRAVPALRIGLGLSLVFVAFTEKFANVPLALAFLQKYPLNFTPALGIGMPDSVFVLCAGAVELLVGLWILFNIFPREIVLVAWIPINLTLTIFNWTELIGHLPIYGIMALLLVWGSDEPANDELWRRGLRERFLSIPAPES
jgi:hypothetical protein